MFTWENYHLEKQSLFSRVNAGLYYNLDDISNQEVTQYTTIMEINENSRPFRDCYKGIDDDNLLGIILLFDDVRSLCTWFYVVSVHNLCARTFELYYLDQWKEIIIQEHYPCSLFHHLSIKWDLLWMLHVELLWSTTFAHPQFSMPSKFQSHMIPFLQAITSSWIF